MYQSSSEPVTLCDFIFAVYTFNTFVLPDYAIALFYLCHIFVLTFFVLVFASSFFFFLLSLFCRVFDKVILTSYFPSDYFAVVYRTVSSNKEQVISSHVFYVFL